MNQTQQAALDRLAVKEEVGHGDYACEQLSSQGGFLVGELEDLRTARTIGEEYPLGPIEIHRGNFPDTIALRVRD